MAFDHALPRPGLADEAKGYKPPEGAKKPVVPEPIRAHPAQWECKCGDRVFLHIPHCPHCGGEKR